MPIFIALFRLLVGEGRVPADASFLFIDRLTATPIEGGIASLGAWVLVIAMGATTYYSQLQMMKNNPASAEQPVMRIMLYVMPVMLTVFAVNFPVGVLLYWVTTNVWTIGQQWVMFRRIEPPAATVGKTAS
jgi:YidC/Oxa1 family membrane protein insertase